jgi:hypothetical protein
VDPNQVDRALAAHAKTQNGLHAFLARHGVVAWSPVTGDPDFDIAWIWKDRLHVAEVKSLTDTNQSSQLRFGLGQVLDYQEMLRNRDRDVMAVLVTEVAPKDDRWVRLCVRHQVTLVWPDTFGLLLS